MLVLFIVVPLLEIYLLIKVGGLIGAWPTVFLVVFTALLGAVLMRIQGFSALRRGQAALARGELPALELMEGVILLLGGVLLLTPGFATDTLGFLCLIPAVRRYAVRWLLRHAVITPMHGGPRPPPRGEGPRTIEGDFRREEDRRPRR